MFCLLLDKRYYPFCIVGYKKAILLYFRNYDCLEFHETYKIHTVSKSYQLPIVLRVNEVIDYKTYFVTPSRKLILIRDNFTCQYCGRSLSEKEATIDHIVPKSKGGLWSWTNLVTCCPECNQRKSDEIWRPRSKPTRPEPLIIQLKRIQNKVDPYTLSVWKNYIPASLKFKLHI